MGSENRRPLSLRDLQALIRRIPFNSSLGIRAVGLHRDGVTIECRLRDDLRNAAGVLHGGVTATLADVAVGMALARHFGGRRTATTVEMKVNFLRPVTGGKVLARSRLLRVGSALCVGHVDLFDGEKRRIGAALVTYMLLERR